MKLHGLGYVGLTAPDPAALLPFWTDVVGMMPALALPGESYVPAPASGGVGIAPDGTTFLKMDDRQWRVAVHPSESAGLAYLGFEVEDDVALTGAMAEVAAAGIQVTLGTAEETVARGVQGLAWCTDPCGNRIELFHGPVHDRNFASPTQAAFKTGPLGMGHALLFVTDLDASLAFYRGALGFKRSDFITIGPGLSGHFLRCTPRHHSVALMHIGPMSMLNHLMFEVTSLDQVGAALDRAHAAGMEITRTLGRHLNDKTVSFYMRSPAGFEVEIGWDSVLVDDATWCDREAAGGEIWGHVRPSPPAPAPATAD
ncbi:MAG TPA: VOC family protein [Acidimicrobiales bacterium]|nr:VOC family protein [Acidimicrobiales bacterium]